MDEYLSFAKELAVEAGNIIFDNFERQVTISTKSDNTLVTEIDKQINRLVIDRIKSRYHDHGIIGEEESLTNNEELQWVCDPLDGTKAFIMGIPNSTFCLALTKEGKVLLSIVYHPFSRRLCYAIRGGGAFCNDTKLRVNDQSIKGGYILMETESYRFSESLKAAGAIDEAVAGSGFEAMLIASGRAAGIMKDAADYHDVAAGSLLVEEAGGKVAAIDGSELRYDKPINGVIISNCTVHDALVAIARSSA